MTDRRTDVGAPRGAGLGEALAQREKAQREKGSLASTSFALTRQLTGVLSPRRASLLLGSSQVFSRLDELRSYSAAPRSLSELGFSRLDELRSYSAAHRCSLASTSSALTRQAPRSLSELRPFRRNEIRNYVRIWLLLTSAHFGGTDGLTDGRTDTPFCRRGGRG